MHKRRQPSTRIASWHQHVRTEMFNLHERDSEEESKKEKEKIVRCMVEKLERLTDAPRKTFDAAQAHRDLQTTT